MRQQLRDITRPLHRQTCQDVLQILVWIMPIESRRLDQTCRSGGAFQLGIDRIEKAIKAGTQVNQVFPRLIALASNITGEGPTLRVHFSKREGAPVRYVSGDDPEAAGAIREVDLQKKYHLSPTALSERLGLSPNKCKALREMLGLDNDQSNMMIFEFGSQKHARFSDNALRILQENNQPEIVEAAWQARPKPRR
jgi:hypothetical protein